MNTQNNLDLADVVIIGPRSAEQYGLVEHFVDLQPDAGSRQTSFGWIRCHRPYSAGYAKARPLLQLGSPEREIVNSARNSLGMGYGVWGMGYGVWGMGYGK